MPDAAPPPLSDRELEVLEILDHADESLQATEISDRLENAIGASTVRDTVAQLRGKGYEILNDTSTHTGYTLNGDFGRDFEAIVNDLRSGGVEYDDLQSKYDLDSSSAQRVFQTLRERGHTIEFTEVDDQGTRRFFIPEETDQAYQFGDGDGVYRFALISDTHLGSKASHLDDLNDFYDRLAERGIDTVFHGGDISDGWEIHRDQINHVRGEAAGWGRMKDYVVENYPQRDGIDTFFISGNHDHAYYKDTGIYFGKLIADARDDLHWLGDSVATILLDAENDIDLELIHPSGGQPYTLGYRAQTLNRERDKDDLPTIQGIAHLHGKLWASAEGVDHALYTGCWKSLTTWGKRKGHAGQIGGFIIELEIEDGELKRFLPEWIDYPTRDVGESFSMTDLAEIAGR